MIARKIVLKAPQSELAEQITARLKIHPILSRIMAARGFQADLELENFLNPSLKKGLIPPEDLVGLKAACELIAMCIREGKTIAIACDFDVDGLSSGSIVVHCLMQLSAHFELFVPNRFEEGYGLSDTLLDRILATKPDLLLTLDFGTTDSEQIKRARSEGLKVIVVDHHQVNDPCPADAFVNPQQSECGFANGTLCTAGLAWYLICGLRRWHFPDQIDPKSYLDLACLGTICDMVPLSGVNRVIAKRGLELIGTSDRPGIAALRHLLKIKAQPKCSDVSFQIGPRINAAGRLDDASQVIELLTTEDLFKARRIAEKLGKLNSKRQKIEEAACKYAYNYAESNIDDTAFVVASEKLHIGVIGLAAQRLVERFYRPSAAIGSEDGVDFKGSVRGVRDFDVVEALSNCSDKLLSFGGHKSAGGFTIEENQIESFRRAFIEEADRQLSNSDRMPLSSADVEVGLEEVDAELVSSLAALAPFGIGNPHPLLLSKALIVEDIQVLKSAHLKFVVCDPDSSKRFTSLFWRIANHPDIHRGACVDIVYRPEINCYQGQSNIQLNVNAVAAHA